MKCPRIILIVDDKEKIMEALQVYLEKKGYQVLCAYGGTTAMKLFKEDETSLVLLDLILPDIIGEQVCRFTRTISHVPIIILTVKAEEADLINGLQMGTDDYIFRPFSPRAVVVKVGTALRRTEGDELINLSVSYNQGKPVIDSGNMIVKVQGREIDLTPTELRVLTTMAKAPNRIFIREQLITYVLNDDFDGYDRNIDAYIKGVRSKIEDNHGYPPYILTVHGLGHKFTGEMEWKKV